MQVKVANIPGKKVEHQGIKVQLLGQIELASERGHPHTFISLGAPQASSFFTTQLICVPKSCAQHNSPMHLIPRRVQMLIGKATKPLRALQ